MRSLLFIAVLCAACGGRSTLAIGGGSAGDDSAAGGGGIAGAGGVPDACTPTAEPVLLAAGQLGPERVVIDETHAYWSDHDVHKGRIMSVPFDGGEPAVIASGLSRPRGIAVDETHVYWTDVLAGKVQRAAKDGGGVDELGPWQHNPTAMALGDQDLFWVNRGSIGDGSIMRWSAMAAAPTQAVGPLHEPFLIALDDSTIWWLNASSPGAGDGSLNARAIDGGPIALWGFVPTPRALAVDGDRVYVGAAGDILATSKQSGPFETLVADSVARGMASDGVYLYWADSTRGVGRVPRHGGVAEWVVDLPGARDVAVDDACVYAAVGSTAQDSDDGTLWKARK